MRLESVHDAVGHAIWDTRAKSLGSCLTLFNPTVFSALQSFQPRTVACQASLSVEFSRQEYWSGLPLPPPEKLPNPGIEPWSPSSRAYSLPFELQESLLKKKKKKKNEALAPEQGHEPWTLRLKV